MHEMRLYNKPFESIKNGNKTIEIRLYDEKRKKIKIGDIIEFTNLDTNEKIKVKVLNLHVFNNFKELFDGFDKKLLGYDSNEKASYLDMLNYYSEEEQKQYGAVGIEIKLIKGDE